MAIDFDASRWDAVRLSHRQWWSGELDRPLMPITLGGRDPGRAKPDVPLLGQVNCHELAIPAERLIDRIDYELSKRTYLGDAFPFFNLDCFGPGVVAAFVGATLDNSTGGVWFHPPVERPIEDIHFRFDPDNVWFRRLCDIYAAGMKRWQGQVLMGMTDLGGNLDVLSSFRPGEGLLLDLYDHPEEVKRLLGEAHEVWHQYYDALNDVLQPVNPGYSDWARIYSETPSYVLQCDFSYMIGPEMFDEFVKPELAASCRRLDHTIYHLDGIGQLSHLDSLLSIPELDAVQWVQGDGQPNGKHWPEVYRKIVSAGKKIQIFSRFDEDRLEVLESVVEQVGTTKGIEVFSDAMILKDVAELTELRKKMAHYGVE